MSREDRHGAPILIELDERRRASLARLDPTHRRYLASVDDAGVIMLRPVEVVPAVVGERPATLNPVEYVGTTGDDVREQLARLREVTSGPRLEWSNRPVEP